MARRRRVTRRPRVGQVLVVVVLLGLFLLRLILQHRVGQHGRRHCRSG